jgi:DNA primase
MISQSSIDNILETARIEEVVGDYVTLKKRGVNMIGLCPFHDEKTPSFIVSPNKGIFKCFGCGVAGNSVKFLMEHEHYSYPEALRSLAAKYQVEIEETGTVHDPKAELKDSLFVVTSYAQKYFSENLQSSDEGRQVGLSYFRERGFIENTIEKFQLGYAPEDKHALTNKAQTDGHSIDLFHQTGLVSKKESGNYDFFRARVMFPIHNQSGKIVGFAGRTLLSDPKVPKYINSPETEIYQKSNVLYGAHLAKNAMRNQDNVLLVEGYTDVISMHQAGIEHILASSGTALTKGQIKLIKRYTNNITLLYDGDAAGIKAATRGLELVLEEDMNVRIVMLPEGEDPDSFVRTQGADEVLKYIKAEAKDFVLFKTDLLLKESAADPALRAGLVKEIVSIIAIMPDPIKRSIYVKECSSLLKVQEELLVQEINRVTRQNLTEKTHMESRDAKRLEAQHTPDAVHYQQPITDTLETQEKDLLRILLEFGDQKYSEEQSIAHYILQELADSTFENQAYATILQEIKQFVETGEKGINEHFMNHTDPVRVNFAIELLVTPYELSENWSEMHDILVTDRSGNFRKDARSAVTRYKLKKVMAMIKQNEQRMHSAMSDADQKTYFDVHAQLIEWKKQLCADLGTVIIR